MNAGKSAALLLVAHNYEEKNMPIILIKPSIDTKGSNKVVSRVGIERKVDILLNPQDLILDKLTDKQKPWAIIVDEAQFLTPKQVEELYFITKIYDIPVLCYGLRCDFQMRGFPGSTRLLELADDIGELKTICSCGNKATQNLRLVNGKPIFEGEQVEIDGASNIQYTSVCGKCYLKIKEKKYENNN